MKYLEIEPDEIIDRNPESGVVRLSDGRQIAGRRIRIIAEPYLSDAVIEPINTTTSPLDLGLNNE